MFLLRTWKFNKTESIINSSIKSEITSTNKLDKFLFTYHLWYKANLSTTSNTRLSSYAELTWFEFSVFHCLDWLSQSTLLFSYSWEKKEFSFLSPRLVVKTKEHSLHYYLPIAGGRLEKRWINAFLKDSFIKWNINGIVQDLTF